jgi:type II secretory pathway pseudopilin PulG
MRRWIADRLCRAVNGRGVVLRRGSGRRSAGNCTVGGTGVSLVRECKAVRHRRDACATKPQTMRASWRRSAVRAFTILEVTIAVVIVLALSALAMPALVRLLERASPGELVSQVGSAVGMCRADAVRGGRAMALVAVPDARRRWTLVGIPLPGAGAGAEPSDRGAASRAGGSGDAAAIGLPSVSEGERAAFADGGMPLVERLLEVEAGKEEYVTLPSGVELIDAARDEDQSERGVGGGDPAEVGAAGDASRDVVDVTSDDAVAPLISERVAMDSAARPAALLIALILPDGTMVQSSAAVLRLSVAARTFDLSVNPWTGAVSSRERVAERPTATNEESGADASRGKSRPADRAGATAADERVAPRAVPEGTKR